MIFSCFARHEDMVRLEQEITEIHAVFMDLATMVSARGDELNRMEDHVNGAITSLSHVVMCSMDFLSILFDLSLNFEFQPSSSKRRRQRKR